MAEQHELFKVPPQTRNSNPMVRHVGLGPEGKRCKQCQDIWVRETRASNRYFKCNHRGESCGPGTDHRANWDACAWFKERKGKMEKVYHLS